MQQSLLHVDCRLAATGRCTQTAERTAALSRISHSRCLGVSTGVRPAHARLTRIHTADSLHRWRSCICHAADATGPDEAAGAEQSGKNLPSGSSPDARTKDDATSAAVSSGENCSSSSSSSSPGTDSDERGAAAPSAASQPGEVHPDDRAGSPDAADLLLGERLRQRTRRVQALEDYRDHMQRPDGEISLLECALVIAKHAHPGLDEAACLHNIDRIAEAVWDSLPEQPVPLRIVQAINRQLYDVHGFRGNQQDYYDPDNSCLNKVLENRAGIPITLSLLYQEVAQRCGLPMVGINLPGHFMLSPAGEELEVLIDAFNNGEVTFLEDAADHLARLHGVEPGMVVIDPKVVTNKTANSIPPRRFLARLLQNLKQIYLGRRDDENLLAIVRYLRATLPDSAPEVRDEGLCLYSLKRFSECGETFKEYLAMAPNAHDAEDIRQLLYRLRLERSFQDGSTSEDTAQDWP